jgi:hypothetical protein
LVAWAGICGCPSAAHAFVLLSRFVDPANGNTAYPDVIDAYPGREYRVRVQIGVFQDGDREVPGGILGWNVGSILSAQGTLRRTPGRLAPFTFAPGASANGVPLEDPFFSLNSIDATLGLQSIAWLPGQPQPQPVAWGYETWASVFEFTVPIAADQTRGFDVRIRGNVPLAYGWFEFATPIPPEGDEPGLVVYGPMLLVTRPIDRTIEFRVVPGTCSAAALAVTMGGTVCRRRRRG